MRPALRSPTVVAVKFDPVGAATDLIAHNSCQAVDTIRLLGALGHAPLRCEALRSVASSGHNGAGRREDARTGNDSLGNGLFEFHVGVASAFGTEFANRREAG